MDLRGWKWKSPWQKRNHILCIIFYLNLLLQGHHAAADEGYRQELKNEIQDSTKLDSLSNYLPYDSKEDSDYKRASSFFPLRGKKFSSDDTADHHLIIPDEEDDKRSQFFPLRGKKVPDDLKRASYFTPMRGRKDDGWIDDYDITDENPYKRASSFMPMRGKKKYEAISDYLTKAGTYSNDIDELLNPQNSNNYQSADKRMSSFVPVRGKRSYEEPPDKQIPLKNDSQVGKVSNHSAQKRAVSFMPMRGRKDSDDFKDDIPGNIVTTLLEKKKYSFLPMRGRREGEIDEQSQDLDKKAMFMPMRGRRKNNDELATDFQDESTIKRASYFMPMRGRRTYLYDIVNGNPTMAESDTELIDDKRASSFMPMRGRRTLLGKNDESNHYKRASSFTLMRGRRSTENMKNEISDLPLSSKKPDSFTPIRVRRSVVEDLKVDPWPADQLMPLINKKSFSFMPMRGRRFIERNITVDPWQADQLMSLFNKKSYSFMPMRGRRFHGGNFTVEPWQVDQLMSLFNKKSSFMPMRGRRLEDGNFTVDPWQADQLISLFNKKLSFMPMRGRRLEDGNFTVDPWPAEQLMSIFNKKSSFMPMRGRRDNDYIQQNSEEMDYSDGEDKRGSYFMPMRGRRLESKERNFFNPYPYFMGGIGSSLIYKPYSDLGLSYNSVEDASERRKKLKINWDAVKRAFHASRGKRFDFDMPMKDQMDSWHNEETAEDLKNNDTKEDKEYKTRAKRSIIRPRLAMQPNRQYIALKRPMSFFATRGKRMDDSAIDKISKLH